MNKLYLAFKGEIKEVEITKETKSRYEVAYNSTCRRYVNKSDLNSIIGIDRFDKYSYFAYVFSDTKEKAIEIYNEGKMEELNYLEKRSKHVIEEMINKGE